MGVGEVEIEELGSFPPSVVSCVQATQFEHVATHLNLLIGRQLVLLYAWSENLRIVRPRFRHSEPYKGQQVNLPDSSDSNESNVGLSL